MNEQTGLDGGSSASAAKSRRGARLRLAAGGTALFLGGGIVGLSLSSAPPVQVATPAAAPAPIAVPAAAGSAGAAQAAPDQGSMGMGTVKGRSAAARSSRTISAAATPGEEDPSACTPGGSITGQALDALTQHVQHAHLERSPGQQVQDLMKTDEYVKLHTGLVQNVIGPTEEALPTLLDGALQALTDHVKHAHLERSPGQQVQDLMKTDEYVKLHTGLVQNVIGPTEEALTTGLCAPGDPDAAAPAPMPGMAPPAPAPDAQAPAPQMPDMAPPAPAPQAPAPAPQAPAPAPQAPAPAPAPHQPQTVTVKMAGTAFTPATIKVHKGDTVVWNNADTTEHTVTSSATRIMASSAISPGKTYKHTFNANGTFRYNCSIHPDMKGSVVVSG